MKKVLIVDDTKNIRTLIKTCLEMEGYEVALATNGLEALQHLQTDQFDLAFLDIKLPLISGTEVFRRIREAGIQTPVIIMTAFATIKNAVECTKLGAVAYLQKPFTAEKVRNVIREVEMTRADQSDNYQALIELGETHLTQGNLEDAFTCFKKALAVNPCCGEAYQLIARAFALQGNPEEAERFAEIARKFTS